MMKHRKRRAEWRHLAHLLMAEKVDAEDAPYPLDKKPWRYYW